MPDFRTIYSDYETTKDICNFCNKYVDDNTATRFLLIRSLDKDNLKEILNQNITNTNNTIYDLTKNAYESSITISELINYIESKRRDIIDKRTQELDGLQNVLTNIPITNCGVRNDRVDDIIKNFVRNKTLRTYNEFYTELNDRVMEKIRQYIMWSYYNQTANDIIELFFLEHNNILPTLRKIHNIDFFVKLADRIIPFDLKITHISDEYFNFISQGITRNNNSNIHDDYILNSGGQLNELKQLRNFYKRFRQNHLYLNLPNITDIIRGDKGTLIDILKQTEDQQAQGFVNEFTENHKRYVLMTQEELHPLEWWNYKYQGERLFCNNNRLFVFLAYQKQFRDGRELKRNFEEIGNKINSMLNNLSTNSIHKIKYHYCKEKTLEDNYTAHALSTIYCEE